MLLEKKSEKEILEILRSNVKSELNDPRMSSLFLNEDSNF